MTISSIKKKGREEFDDTFDIPHKAGCITLDPNDWLSKCDCDRENMIEELKAFLDKQMDIAFEEGKKEAIMVNEIVTPHLQKQMLKLVEDSLKVSP